jgi:aspartyl-tRNA(Asn)/glutamyl-tRNA(Gln) amidotransferase subunit A
METTSMTIKQMQSALASGETTSHELVEKCLAAIKKSDIELNSFVRVFENAIEAADASDNKRESGGELGVLEGIPIAMKDNLMVKGFETTAGSQILEGHKAAYDSTVAARLKNAGAILVGSTNMDEFAMGSSTETSHFGTVKNPWDITRVPGGSSGGSAVAVAAGFVPAALGSDTGGSIRQPAALCGVVGLKPTYGRVSRYGLIALASSLDQIGPIARTVEDAAVVLSAIEGRDEKDGTSAELSQTIIPELMEKDLSRMKIGLPKEYFVEGMDNDVRQSVMEAVKVLERAGAKIEEISLPHTKYALADYYIIQPSEASSNLGRYDGFRFGYHSCGKNLNETYERTRGEGFGAEVKRRIMLGSFTLCAGYSDAYYKKALKVRTLIKRDFDDAFKRVQAIVTPTTPSVAWSIGEKFDDPLTMYLSDIYTVTANLTTVPAISIPCGFVNGLPVGMQIMAREFDEYSLLRAGAVFQEKTQWHLRTP